MCQGVNEKILSLNKNKDGMTEKEIFIKKKNLID